MKKVIIMFLIVVMFSVWGCSVDNGIENSQNNGTQNTADNNVNETIKLDNYLTNVESIEIVSGESVKKTLSKSDSEFLELVNELKTLDYHLSPPVNGRSYNFIRLNYSENSYAVIDCYFVKVCNKGVGEIENICCDQSKYTEIINKYIQNNNNQGTDELNTSIVRSGYSSSGSLEPTLPFFCAYQMKRSINEKDESINVDLSFGIEAVYINIESEWKSCNRFVIGVRNQDEENVILEELTAEQFFTEKYEVEIEYFYKDTSEGRELANVTYNYSNTTAFQIPSSLCNKSEGNLTFYLYALNEENICGAGAETVYYTKINGTIQFQNYIEYYSYFFQK